MGLRLQSDARVEGGTGDFDFARGMLDATVSRGLGRGLSAAITAAGGSSQGVLPPQRLWYLGGLNTVRGQPLAAASGDAFWMGRAELGLGPAGVRLAPFFDLGWAGDRHDWRHPGQPISGAGLGMSFLDGMFRVDAAKGIRPSQGWRFDLSVEARF
jgi:hemolysin activation/secretion protein